MAIPLALVTGFLGSGKTTLLARLLTEHRGARWAVVVNDFPPKDVDAARLDFDPARLLPISGGSLLCRCKVTDFIAVLNQLAGTDLDAVVVETSGMADPSALPTLLAETGLGAAFDYRRAVAVVDPASLLKLWNRLPAIRKQVACADLVLLNKADAASATDRALARELITRENRRAEVVETVRCQHPVDLLAPGRRERPAGPLAPCRDPDFSAALAEPPGPVDWPTLRAAFERLGERLFRVKGAISTPAGRLRVDYSLAGWSEEPLTVAAAREADRLAIVVHGPEAVMAEALALQIGSGAFGPE